MLRRKISILWFLWVVALGALGGAWAFSLGPWRTCLYDAQTGVRFCLSGGALSIDTGITVTPLPANRFEIFQSAGGDATAQPLLRLPLWFPTLLVFLSVPLIRFGPRVRRALAERRRPHLCLNCGCERKANGSAACPRCGSVSGAADPVALLTGVALPCAACAYDLRGVSSGTCPECGAQFDRAKLRPMREGLMLERWWANATTWWRRAIFPWRVGMSPFRAFCRECPPDRVLTASPKRYVPWMILAFVILALISNTAAFVIDQATGVYAVYADDQGDIGWRFGSFSLLPVHLPLIWLQSLAVCIVGMLIGWRPLSAQQIARLATWVAALGLLAGLLATLYHAAWDTFLPRWMSTWRFIDAALLMRIFDAAQGLSTRSSDLFFGLLAGLAVGTVAGRRRWTIALVAASMLYAGFPAYLEVQWHYERLIHAPLRNALLGPPAAPPDLSGGPTFDPHEAEPLLAGHWRIDCQAGRDMAVTEMAIDAAGRPTRFRLLDPESGLDRWFVADGQVHEIALTDPNGAPATARYQCFAACRSAGSNVTINTRLEWYIDGGPAIGELASIYEYRFAGQLDVAAGSIEGASLLVIDSGFALVNHPRRQRSFTMQRLPASPDARPPNARE